MGKRVRSKEAGVRHEGCAREGYGRAERKARERFSERDAAVQREESEVCLRGRAITTDGAGTMYTLTPDETRTHVFPDNYCHSSRAIANPGGRM